VRILAGSALSQALPADVRRVRSVGSVIRETFAATRAGIFHEKITDAERVLATILGLRKNCSWDAVAELFHVSRRTIGSARARVAPLLEQDRYRITPASTRYPSATALLAAIQRQQETPDTPQTSP
jgi:hypothetical protein